MNDLIYSLNATMPVFLVIVAGFLLRKAGFFNEGFISAADKFIFHVALPVMVFSDMAQSDLKADMQLPLVGYASAATTAAFIIIWICARLFIKDRSITGAFVQAAYRSSVAVMGFAFMQNIYGGVGLMPMIVIGCVPLYNIYAVTVLTFESDSQNKGKDKIKQSIIGICKNPIIISILLGTAASISGVYAHFPVIAVKTLSSIASIATPLSLIVIGASFKGMEALKKLRPTVICCMIKLIVMPLVFVSIAVRMGFTGQALLALVIMLGSPTTPSCYIMAKNMGNDEVLTSSVITATTFFSSVTLTLCIYLCRSMGLI
ncbi:MAG: AEC family transporter [Oscillospiraceae bacterium]|nr:AEC family transporter [Oscillospiraceae bacterium]